MKALFLLLIIYNLHNLARSQNESTIIHKAYPKKVHPAEDNIKLINTGAYYKKNEKPIDLKKSFTRFQPPIPEWNSKKKVLDSDSYFPLEFYGNLKSRVKKFPYFSDKDVKRAKRAANVSHLAEKTSPSSPTTQKPKSKDTKPPELKSVASASPKNASTNRRSSGKHAKTAAKANYPPKPALLTQADPKREQPNKTAKQEEPAKKTALRRPKGSSHHRKLTRPGKKHAKPKRALTGKKRSHRSSGKAHAHANKGKGGKHSAVKPARNKAQGKVNPKGKVSPKGKVNTKGKVNPKARAGSRRLISARDALPEDYPYVVSIQKDGQHWCTGSILNPTLIISSANCFWKSRSVSRMKIRAGAKNIDEGGQTAHIAEVRKHPYWDVRKDPDNDLALALLDRRLKFSHSVHEVDLPNKVMMPAFEDAWVTSYGADRRDGIYARLRLTLQVMRVRLMARSVCNNITMRFNVPVTENFICLEQAGRRSPCTRDTGAPAVSDGVLWGVASWGIRKLCGTERFPAMFSYVASKTNMNFIMNATAAMMGDERLSPMLGRPPMRAHAEPDSASTIRPNEAYLHALEIDK